MTNKDFYPHQRDAIRKMKNGCVLVGGVGSGKSRTAIGYYLLREAKAVTDSRGNILSLSNPLDIYIITTARKRDTLDWLQEAAVFGLSDDRSLSISEVKVTVDSWSMIEKYEKVTGAFFIFDEQRAIGSGKWGKKFIKIAKANRWIMLSATPGDTWLDYANLFIANGFYKHKTEFISEHVVFSRFSKFPKVERYINCERLVRYRDSIVVPMPFERDTVRHELTIKPKYDAAEYKRVLDIRRDPRTNLPMQNAGQLCYALRYVVNKDLSRADAIKKLTEKHDRLIVFYNFIYELDILREMCEELEINYAEWNGERHESIPSTKRWIYLVQYTAGAEGWNCISTNVVVFYSQNYSYKIMAQSAGRIDRLNTKYIDLYYYHLISDASIDKAISRTLAKKETFNEKLFAESQK